MEIRSLDKSSLIEEVQPVLINTASLSEKDKKVSRNADKSHTAPSIHRQRLEYLEHLNACGIRSVHSELAKKHESNESKPNHDSSFINFLKSDLEQSINLIKKGEHEELFPGYLPKSDKTAKQKLREAFNYIFSFDISNEVDSEKLLERNRRYLSCINETYGKIYSSLKSNSNLEPV